MSDRQIINETQCGKLNCTSVVAKITGFVLTLAVKTVTGVLDS
ncbi:hypothetical protein [Nostoc sp.]